MLQTSPNMADGGSFHEPVAGLAMTRAKRPPMDVAFDGALMERYWVLETAFLAALADTTDNLNHLRNKLLISAVLFGGLINPKAWPEWVRTVMAKLRALKPNDQLPPGETRSVYIASTRRLWFADPVTRTLLERPIPDQASGRAQPTDGDAGRRDFNRLITIDELSLFNELRAWVLPAARVKMGLMLPSIVLEHCSGQLDSKSLSKMRWSQIHCNSPVQIAPYPLTAVEPIRRERPSTPSKARSGIWFEDIGFSFIEKAIFSAMQVYATAANPTLDLEQTQLHEEMKRSQERHANYAGAEETFGWWVHEWFLQHCPKGPQPRDSKPKRRHVLRARTMYNYAFSFGLRVNWDDLWTMPLQEIAPQAVADRLHKVVRLRPDAFHTAKWLYGFLGFGVLTWPEGVSRSEPQANTKVQIVTAPEFHAILDQLLDRDARPGAHWLAAVLMFRCGLRTREVIALEIDHVTVVDGLVELRVEATPYVKLKNATSRRVVPLHALLSPLELATLLQWRATRIRECHMSRQHERLLFATVFHQSDYAYLLDPIESAIRRARNEAPPTAEQKASASYIFGRCSSLRHSFASYALASLLMPEDDGGFVLPAGITPDLISLNRRNRLERALLAEGHMGLSSVEALRQLMGHSHLRRTLGTYVHLMDLTAAAYSWRRAIEPSLPAYVVQSLATDQVKSETLIRYAAAGTAREQAAWDAAADALKQGQQVVTVFPPRARRRLGKSVAPWEPQGNAFLSQLRSLRSEDAAEETCTVPEWRTDTLDDWRTIDLILQMASRCVPAALIADEVGVRVDAISRLTRRYYELLSVRRKETKLGAGLLRHGIVLESNVENIVLGHFDDDDACWYGPLKRLPADRGKAMDVIWQRLVDRRSDQKAVVQLRAFICTHQDGKIQHRRPGTGREDRLEPIEHELAALLDNLQPPFATVRIRDLRKHNRRELSIQPRQENTAAAKFRTMGTGLSSCPPADPGEDSRLMKALRQRRMQGVSARWPAAAALLQLMLMAEAASCKKLPRALVRTPPKAGPNEAQANIDRWEKEKKAARAEAEAAALEAKDLEQRKAWEAQQKAKRMARFDSRKRSG